MKRIIIVEDERIEREFMLKTVKEYMKNNAVIDSFESAEEALQAFKKEAYDIAFLDIHLGTMDGLTLAKELKEINQDLKFFMVTSYNYFDYALESIRLGVVDYILKPTRQDTIINALENLLTNSDARSDIFQKQALIMRRTEEDFVYALLVERSDKEIKDIAKKMGVDLHSISSVVFPNEGLATQQEIQLDSKVTQLIFDHGSIVLYVYLYTEAGQEDANLGKIYSNHYHESLTHALMTYFEPVKGQYLIGSIHDIPQILNYYFTKYRFDSREVDIVAEYISFHLYRKSDSDTYDYINLLQTAFFNELNKKGIVLSQELIYISRKQASMGSKLIEIQMLVDQIAKTYVQHTWVVDNHSDKQIVIRSHSYLRSNYKKPISLNDLSDELQLSPFHVSKVLSSADTNFTEMLNGIRIKKAKELLKTSMNIKEIAHEIGYTSPTYFSRVFKKYVGVTPSQYQLVTLNNN